MAGRFWHFCINFKQTCVPVSHKRHRKRNFVSKAIRSWQKHEILLFWFQIYALSIRCQEWHDYLKIPQTQHATMMSDRLAQKCYDKLSFPSRNSSLAKSNLHVMLSNVRNLTKSESSMSPRKSLHFCPCPGFVCSRTEWFCILWVRSTRK